VADRERLAQARAVTAGIRLTDALVDYIVDVIRATREQRRHRDRRLHPGRQHDGRGGAGLCGAERARFRHPDDIKALAVPLLRHRVILAPNAEIDGLTRRRVLREISTRRWRRDDRQSRSRGADDRLCRSRRDDRRLSIALGSTASIARWAFVRRRGRCWCSRRGSRRRSCCWPGTRISGSCRSPMPPFTLAAIGIDAMMTPAAAPAAGRGPGARAALCRQERHPGLEIDADGRPEPIRFELLCELEGDAAQPLPVAGVTAAGRLRLETELVARRRGRLVWPQSGRDGSARWALAQGRKRVAMARGIDVIPTSAAFQSAALQFFRP